MKSDVRVALVGVVLFLAWLLLQNVAERKEWNKEKKGR